MISDESYVFRIEGILTVDSHIPASDETDRIGSRWFALDEEAKSYVMKDGDLISLSRIARKFLPNEEEIIWFTDDYDLYGCYRDSIETLKEKMDRIFELGASSIHFMTVSLKQGFSIESYIYRKEFYVKICGYGLPYSEIPNKIQQLGAFNSGQSLHE